MNITGVSTFPKNGEKLFIRTQFRKNLCLKGLSDNGRWIYFRGYTRNKGATTGVETFTTKKNPTRPDTSNLVKIRFEWQTRHRQPHGSARYPRIDTRSPASVGSSFKLSWLMFIDKLIIADVYNTSGVASRPVIGPHRSAERLSLACEWGRSDSFECSSATSGQDRGAGEGVAGSIDHRPFGWNNSNANAPNRRRCGTFTTPSPAMVIVQEFAGLVSYPSIQGVR